MEGVSQLDAKIQRATAHWREVSKVLYYPHNENEYNEAVRLLDSLIDTIGEDQNHPLASLMDILGLLIEKYEDGHVPQITQNGAKALLIETTHP